MVREFVDRVFDDVMIGFHFRDADRDRVHRHETELACVFLGGPEEYTGRPIREAHSAHPITGGQFMRRWRILEDVLTEHEVPADIIERWREHTEARRHLVTGNAGSSCIHQEAAPRE
jgi:hemoglobin